IMNTLLKLSEAGSIAIHALAMIAGNKNKKISSAEIADFYGISRNHLAKVMQQLVKVGFVKSDRGPSGGFTLAKDASKITLLDIYCEIEGGISLNKCLLEEKFCFGSKCLLGNMLSKINRELKNILETTKLSDIALNIEKRGTKK
ncbi:MAG TPA: Rrf2 family transcriptional regulator, partial [Victivallales bacterium]|nr:Rrf2 family transcriptional regulator [Victivallales bacterium]